MFDIFKRRKARGERRVQNRQRKRTKYSLKWKRYLDVLKKVFKKRKPNKPPLHPYEELFIDASFSS